MPPQDEINNKDVFLWALFRLGGQTDFVDVEDIYIRCFDLAPRRFSWRTKEIPDLKKCAKALRDTEAMQPPLLVKTEDSYCRKLTVEGQQWIEDNTPRLTTGLEGDRIVQEPKSRPNSRLLAPIEKSDLFAAWRATAVVPDEKWRIAELFRCAPDSPLDVWRKRMQSLRGIAYAAEKRHVLEFLDALETTHPHWFKESVDVQ